MYADKVVRRWDPENDSGPNAPDVTWAEAELAYYIQELERRVNRLEERVRQLLEAVEGV